MFSQKRFPSLPTLENNTQNWQQSMLRQQCLPGALVSFANFVICVIFRDFLILCECEQFGNKSKSDITHHSEYFYVRDGLTMWNI